MATKPTDTLDWVATGKRTDPGGTLRTNGYDPGNRFRAQHHNFVLKLLTDWIKYISDGVFTGATEFVNAVTFDSTVTLVASDVNHAARTHSFTGRSVHNPSLVSNPKTGAVWFEMENSSGLGNSLMKCLDLQAGDKLSEVKVNIRDTVGKTVTLSVFEYDDFGGAPTQLGSTQTSDADGTDQTLTCTFTPRLVGDMYSYIAYVTMNDDDQRLYGGRWKASRG
jgi:hypothetical protein